MAKYKTGDRVRCTAWAYPSVGTIVKTYGNYYDVCLDCKEKPKHVAWRDGKHYIVYQCDAELEPLYAQSIHIYTDGATTTAVLKDGKKTVKAAQAKCGENDVFDFNIGACIAMTCLMSTLVSPENFQKCLSQLVAIKTSDKPAAVREVKRPAKAGEWVKIVRGDGRYFEGEIYKTEAAVPETGGCRIKHPKGTSDGCAYLFYSEYVVLENYQPPKPSLTDEQWAQFKAGKLAVNCKTEDDARAFLGECEKRGYKWCSGEPLGECTHWDSYESKTCYDIGPIGFGYAPIGGMHFARYPMQIITYTKEASK
jgi:hypothetical protein